MSRKKKSKIEYRYYEMPAGSPVLALLGEKWYQNYGRGIDYLHFHNHLEIGYCYQGNGALTLEDKDIHYHGEMFSVIPANFLHTTNSIGDHICHWEYLFIDVEGFLSQIYKDNAHMKERLIQRVNQRACFYRESERPAMAALIHQIIETMRERKEFYLEEVKGYVLALLIEIARDNAACKEIRKIEKQEQDTKAPNSSVISQALDYISEFYSYPIRIEELAKICHISETHFRRVFHECMHMTPVEYINWVRVRAACELLRKSNDSVSSIASRTGFATLSTFNRNFQRFMSISPQQWRKNPEHYERKLLEYDIKIREGW